MVVVCDLLEIDKHRPLLFVGIFFPGKKKEKVVGSSNEDSDSDYTEANEDSESDDTEASDQLNAFSESSNTVAQPKKKRERG